MSRFFSKHERIDEDFSFVKTKLNFNITLTKSNVVEFESNVQEEVYELYSKNFELFGY